MSIFSSQGVASVSNSTTTPLNAGLTYTGTGELNNYPDVTISCKTDQAGTLYVEFSPDGTNWDSQIRIYLEAGTNEFHKFTKGSRYFRIRITNTSASNQTYLRLNTSFGYFGLPTSGLSGSVQQDSDAITARIINQELGISLGFFSGYSIVNKFGRNSDIDPGSVPEDIWNGGGTYTGFPTGAPEEFEVFSSSAGDTGTITFTYLASTTSTAYQTATVTLNGTTPVSTGVTGYRMHTARYASGSATAFNLGTITIRHKVTTANVFCSMPIGRGQTNVAAYTVPYGYTAILTRLFCRVIGNASGIVDGALWVREGTVSPRLRRPFSAGTADHFEEQPYGGLQFNQQSDIMVRISSSTANNMDVIAGYDLILVKNI